MKKDDTGELIERGTLVKCMSRGGVVVATSPASVPDGDEATGEMDEMA